MFEVASEVRAIFDPAMFVIFREIAQRVGMHEDDITTIFNISSGTSY